MSFGSDTRQRPPQSGFVQTGFGEVWDQYLGPYWYVLGACSPSSSALWKRSGAWICGA